MEKDDRVAVTERLPSRANATSSCPRRNTVLLDPDVLSSRYRRSTFRSPEHRQTGDDDGLIQADDVLVIDSGTSPHLVIRRLVGLAQSSGVNDRTHYTLGFQRKAEQW